MPADQPNEPPREPTTQGTVKPAETTAPQAEEPQRPRGFWRNPTQPLEKSFRKQSERERK
jgi:hypothetical protein